MKDGDEGTENCNDNVDYKDVTQLIFYSSKKFSVRWFLRFRGILPPLFSINIS